MIDVTFSGNTGSTNGGGMYNDFSSPTLINVTFSGNAANTNGGGMYNDLSSSTLINVTFSGNTANHGSGGGIYHSGGNGHPLTLINTILWGNNNGNILVFNDTPTTETVNLYYSLIQGGTIPSTTATGIRLLYADTNTYPVTINSKEVITNNPGLGPLANNGGEVDTISISSSSLAKDKGVYVMGVKAGNAYPASNLYYSRNNTDWYSDIDLTTPNNPLNNADDLTATDARGYGRVGRPDMGAYEERGTQ